MTSAEWKESYTKPLLNETYVEIEIDCTDDVPLRASTIDSTASVMPGSNLASIVQNVHIERSGTLEEGVWTLDGNSAWLNNESSIGYVSNAVSGEDKQYEENPNVVIELDEAKSIPGITITWSKILNEWAESFTVEFFDSDGASLHKAEYERNTSVVANIMATVDNCKKIVITVLKWCAYGRRARIENVIAGAMLHFTKKELMSFNAEYTCSPINAELPTCIVKFSVENYDGRYSANGNMALNKYIAKQQKVTVRYGLMLDSGTIEYINGATVYVDSWGFESDGKKFSVSCRDSLYFMQNAYMKGTYNMQGATLKALAMDVIQDAGTQYTCIAGSYLDDSLESFTSMAYLPKNTHAELLQLIAQSSGMVLMYDREGTIRIEPLPETSQGDIDEINFYAYPQYTLNDLPGILNCKVYNYATTKVIVEDDHYPNVAGNDYVSSQDAQLIWNAVTKIGTGQDTGLTPEQEVKADADMDGAITAWDATLISRYAAYVGTGIYTPDLNGWETFFNETNGNKKIVSRTDVQLNPNNPTIVTINYSPSYDIAIHRDSTISNMEIATEFTTLTIEPGEGIKTIDLYGYPISSSSFDYPVTVIEGNDKVEGVDNPLITNTGMASASMNAVKDWITKTHMFELSNYRSDPSFDIGIAKYGDTTIFITDIKYVFNGAFHGSVEGKVIE